MAIYKCTYLLLITAVLCGCGPRKSGKDNAMKSPDAPVRLEGNISVSGAFALYPLASKWADDFMALHPDVRIEVSRTGTGQGIEDLKSQKCQVAMISRQLTDDEITSGVWVVPVAKDGVGPIISIKNPFLRRIIKMGLTPEEFMRAFTSENPVTWGELLDTVGPQKVATFIRKDESGAEDVWADFLYRGSADLKGIEVHGDEEMIKMVGENPFALGFCNFSYAFDIKTGDMLGSIQIVPFDLDFDNKIANKEIPFTNLEKANRGLWLGLYPKILCRELTVGTIGKPSDPVVIEFMKYALTKGQDDVKMIGLCELNGVYIEYALDKLK
jgi:phosphate transport system substrate-binding protein